MIQEFRDPLTSDRMAVILKSQLTEKDAQASELRIELEKARKEGDEQLAAERQESQRQLEHFPRNQTTELPNSLSR
jgi:hypothetical protein